MMLAGETDVVHISTGSMTTSLTQRNAGAGDEASTDAGRGLAETTSVYDGTPANWGNRRLIADTAVGCETCGAPPGAHCENRDATGSRVLWVVHWRRRYEALELTRIIKQLAHARRVNGEWGEL